MILENKFCFLLLFGTEYDAFFFHLYFIRLKHSKNYCVHRRWNEKVNIFEIASNWTDPMHMSITEMKKKKRIQQIHKTDQAHVKGMQT